MTTGGAASPAGARRSWQSSGSGSGSGSEREEMARALPSPPPKPRRLSLRSSNQDADARLSILSSDLDHEFLDDDDDDGLRGSFASLSPRSTRTVSSIDDLEKRRNPSILFGRDVIQVPLKIADRDEYVNLVLSHREFDAMAVHIPQYDQMPPLELVEQIARVVKDAESKKKHKLGVAPADGDASGVFQGRVLEQEYEIKRLETKLAAARALQTSLTDENTTLRMNVRELEESELDYEKVYLQNELLREQALNAVAEVARMKRVAADARNQLQFFTQELKALKTQVANTQSSMLDATHGALADVVENVYQREKVLQESYLEEKAERQLIAEKYYELSGRIRVFCRLRPSTSEHSSALLRPRHNSILVEKSGKEFVFDQVFGPESAQPEVYRQMEPLVVSFADGYNACILAYGQTGSGKTYTMMGNSDDPASADAGMIPRALQQVFSIIEARKLTYQDVVTVSMVEIYNDQILDLLGDENHSDSSNSSSSKHQPVIKSESEIVERSVTLWSQVQATLAEGNANRNIASTSMNVESSRSHAMVFLHLESQHRETMEMRKSTLCLVDLAGSERISRSKVEGDRLKETQHINKSLSALGDVIYALQHKAKHVPYRNSKLTYMLRDMLSGQAKTLMMLQLSPDNLDVEETKCSLNFGARVSQVQMGAVRQSVESGEIFKLKDENQSLGKKVASLERKLAEYKQQYEQKSCELKSTIKSKRSLERQLWLLGGSEHDAPPEPSPQSVPSASPPTSPDIPLHPPSPTGSVKSTRSTFSTASSRSNRESGSTRRSLASSFSRLIGGRGGSSKTSSAAPAAPAPSPPGSLDRENRRKSLNGVRSERSTLADREARRQSLGARTTSSAAADAEARRRSLNPRADSTLDQEARRKSLSSLSTRTSSQSSLLSSRKVPEAPSSLPTRRPLFPTSSSSSSMIPPAPGSGSRIPKTRSMASSFTGSTTSTPTRAAVRRTVSSAASPNTGSTISSNVRSASAASSGIASRGEPRRSTLNNGASARSTSTARTTATASASARRAPTTSSWK